LIVGIEDKDATAHRVQGWMNDAKLMSFVLWHHTGENRRMYTNEWVSC
jgi:hypothetical protein